MSIGFQRIWLPSRKSLVISSSLRARFQKAISSREPVSFNWEKVKGATSYDVEVSLDKNFNEVLETWNVNELSVQYGPKKPGRYYFRVTPRFMDLVIKESSSVGELDVRYETPKIKDSEDEVRWQRVPDAKKYLVKIKSKEEARSKSELPMRYVALFTGFGQYKLDSTIVANVSKSGLLHAFEASWSKGHTDNFAMRFTAISNHITRDTLLVPEVSYNYEWGDRESFWRYIGLSLKRESISLIAGNNYLGTAYLYHRTKFIGHISSRLSYQLDLEHTGGILGLSQLYLDYQRGRFHLYLKIFNQTVTIESPSSKTESEYSCWGAFFGLGTTF